MEPIRGGKATPSRRGGLWGLLTFERLITGPAIHLVYWAGLGVIMIVAFSVIGAAIGVAWREGGLALLLAAPVLVAGVLAVLAGALIWRAFCEFYVAIFRIGDDLAALRKAVERSETPKS
jgi:zinc transporter ZupT